MQKNNAFTKILALSGTIFAWVPIVAPLLFGGLVLVRAGILRVDYLMPAEFFPVALLGGGLLIWAALRARLYRRLICWSVAAAVLLLIASQVLAVVTGLASGAAEPTGAAWALVVACLILFILALITTAIGGILLVRNLFKSIRQPAEIINS